jgi:16S rRNA processing protein RimM
MLMIVGKVVRPHGIRGEVTVDVRTDEPTRRFVPGAVLQTDPPEVGPLTIDSVRPHQGRLLVTFQTFADRALADNLRGVLLCVDSDEIPVPTDEDEFLDHQLVGLRAESPTGEVLGEVVRVEHAPASELLVVERPDGRTALVPFVKAIVPEVDLSAGRVVLTPPEGLLDL